MLRCTETQVYLSDGQSANEGESLGPDSGGEGDNCKSSVCQRSYISRQTVFGEAPLKPRSDRVVSHLSPLSPHSEKSGIIEC